MKVIMRVPLFALLCGAVLFWAAGCEDSPNAENVGSYFDGRDISADTSTPTRRPREGETAPATLEELVIRPAGGEELDDDGRVVELTLPANGDIAHLRLGGAVGAVSWSVSEGTGEIVTQSNTGATYRRTGAGDNVVIARDSSGREAFKVIRQP